MPLTGQAKLDYQRRWIAERRQRAILLLGSRCARCGSDEDLEIDHIDRDAKHPLLKGGSIQWSWAWTRILAELEKCQLLCDGCHKAKTADEAIPPHGVNSRYTSPRWACRCPACRKAHAIVNAKYR